MNSHKPDTVRSIIRIVAGAAGVLLIGWWQGNPLVFLSVYGLGLAIWEVWQRGRFERWLVEFGENNLGGRWSQIAQHVSHRINAEQRKNVRVESILGNFEELAEKFPDGIVVLQSDWRIVWFNKAAGTWLCLAPGDIGQRIDNLVRHPRLLEPRDAENPLIMSSPVDDDVALSLEILEGTHRRCLIARDVTARQKSEKARHDFVANASHELRSPLTVIRGYLDALATEQSLDAVWHDPVEEMRRQAQRMSDLLTDLMDLSRLDTLQLKAEWMPIDMGMVIEHVKNECVQLADGPCDISVSVDRHYWLLGEQVEILSVLLNLMANAIRYSGDDRKIRISWVVDANGGHLAVRDNGIGIPEEDIPRLTERFYRVDKGRSRDQGGTGLGLSIVRNTLSRHDGYLEIQSKLGEGSTFTCHFPASRVGPAADDALATG